MSHRGESTFTVETVDTDADRIVLHADSAEGRAILRSLATMSVARRTRVAINLQPDTGSERIERR